MFETPASRRDFLKKTAYVTPLILTMNVSLAEAQAGSGPPIDRSEDFSSAGSGEDGSQPVGYDSSGLEHPGRHRGWWKHDHEHNRNENRRFRFLSWLRRNYE